MPSRLYSPFITLYSPIVTTNLRRWRTSANSRAAAASLMLKAVPPKETTMSARTKMLAIASIVSLATSLSFAASSSRTAASYAQRLPVTFQQNMGQAPAQVRYIARESAFNLYLNKDESVLQFF